MLLVVTLDITQAVMPLFEDYESRALALLQRRGGRLIERLRSDIGDMEFHLLEFDDRSAFAAFLSDPARADLRGLWERCGVTASIVAVHRVG